MISKLSRSKLNEHQSSKNHVRILLGKNFKAYLLYGNMYFELGTKFLPILNQTYSMTAIQLLKSIYAKYMENHYEKNY